MAAGGESAAKKLQKSYFDVLGLCCSSEVPLVENILKSLDGVKEFHVIVPTKTVVVIHDTLLISPLQIVKALNQGRLEANVRVNGEGKQQRKLPSPYAMASGFLLLVSLFKFVYPPLQWVALGAVAVGILPIFLKALASLRNYSFDTNLLMLIAVVGTIALEDYIEAGAIVFLFTIAEWLESRAGHKAQAEMSSLMSRTPQKAVVAETGEEVDVDEVKLSTVLAVRGGEVIPIDGIVVDGNCEVDEKTLTGESFPVSKQIDSTVWAGTININGYISVKTTALAEDCVVAKMAQLVEDAQNSKTKTQRFIDKCAQYYTPAVILISATIALVPLVVKVHNRNQWFHLALVVLVSACPCALILSTPVATFCALTKAAKAGLLIKGGEYLETLAKIKAMAFDKTGTITRGEFVVTHFQSLSHCINLEELLSWVASIESKSSHPMAAALIDYASTFSIQPKPENVVEFRNFPGEGIHGKIDGRDVYIGNRKISLRAGSSTVPTLEPEISRGKTVGYIYCGASPAGIFTLSDVCRTGVSEAIRDLKLLGIKTAMLTGDSEAAALHVQGQLEHGVEVVHAELLPEDKARIIQELKKEGPTAMIGDGVNDAPALATADIGISMGISGSALATETGHVILMSNDIRKVPKAITLARKAHRKVVENVVLSISTKAAILALAIAGHPLVWAAVLADVGTCVLVILNSMLLLRHRSSHDGCKKSAAQHNHKHGHKNLPHSQNKGCCSKNVGNTCKAETTSCASRSQSSHLSLNACSDNKCADTAARQHQNCTGAGEVLEEKKPCCQSRGCSSANRKTELPKSYKQRCPNNKRKDTTERQHQNCTGADKVVEEKKPCCQGQGCSSASRKTESPKSHKQQCSSTSISGSCTKRDECGNVEEKVDTITGQNDLDGVKVKRSQHSHCEKASECCSKSVGEIAGVKLHGEHVDKCCKENRNESHVAIDISEDDHEHHVETRSSRHGCKSLENREMGGCCKSYMKECCGSKHGQFATGFAGTCHEITIKEA